MQTTFKVLEMAHTAKPSTAPEFLANFAQEVLLLTG